MGTAGGWAEGWLDRGERGPQGRLERAELLGRRAVDVTGGVVLEGREVKRATLSRAAAVASVTEAIRPVRARGMRAGRPAALALASTLDGQVRGAGRGPQRLRVSSRSKGTRTHLRQRPPTRTSSDVWLRQRMRKHEGPLENELVVDSKQRQFSQRSCPP